MSLLNLKILHPNIELVRENQGIQPEKDKIFKSNNPKNLTYVILYLVIPRNVRHWFTKPGIRKSVGA